MPFDQPQTESTFEKHLFLEAINDRATDIHIDPQIKGYCVRFRIDGTLRIIHSLEPEDGLKLVNQIKADMGIEPGTVFYPVGVRRKLQIGEKSVDLRVTLVPCISGPKVSIRVLDQDRVDRRLTNLGLSENDEKQLSRWASELDGMILLTGPTGSGKTTTAYALLHEISGESNNVITIEDPVEYEFDGINQIQVDQRHELGFAEGIKTSLRLDPDCLMIGEIREPEAACQAINAAIRGHVVIATLHSRDTASVVTRLRNFGLQDHQIAASLGVVVNQRLVRVLCRHCRDLSEATQEGVDYFESRKTSAPERVAIPRGCEKCDNTGYRGLTAIFEVWNLGVEDYKAILRGDDEEKLRQGMKERGHRILLDDASAKTLEGIISLEDIKRSGLDLPWRNK